MTNNFFLKCQSKEKSYPQKSLVDPKNKQIVGDRALRKLVTDNLNIQEYKSMKTKVPFFQRSISTQKDTESTYAMVGNKGKAPIYIF